MIDVGSVGPMFQYTMQYQAASLQFAPAMPAAVRNLVLVHRRGVMDIEDLERIRAIIHAQAPDIEVFIVHSNMRCSVTAREAARRPSLVVSPARSRKFVPRGGKIYMGHHIRKFEQAWRLHAADIAAPATIMFEMRTALDPVWGTLSVVKPDRSGGGDSIEVWRTGDLNGGQRLWPEGDRRHEMAMIAQKFIHTGRYPSKYRLLTMFGRPLYCEHQASVDPSPEVDPDGAGEIAGLITSPASSSATTGTRRNTVCYDEDVLALGPAVAAVFPEIPVLGLDILREASTGKLYVLEINPEGHTWHLSSRLGKLAQQRQNIDRYAQFDALSVAANALIEKTRAEAE